MMRRPRGFTLVETLVALVVLSAGLLGAAALLLDNLRGHSGALRRVAASNLVRDMADRIRANPRAGVHYNLLTPPTAVSTASAAASAAASACGEPSGCDIAQLAAADCAHFETAARALFPGGADARLEFAPATGPATPARYLITLRWLDPRNDADTESVALQVLWQEPVAG
jgi:type IV pilus assembly protein PilV